MFYLIKYSENDYDIIYYKEEFKNISMMTKDINSTIESAFRASEEGLQTFDLLGSFQEFLRGKDILMTFEELITYVEFSHAHPELLL